MSRVVARDDLDGAVDEVVDGIIRSSASTLMIGRDSFYGMLDADFDAALDRLQIGLTETAMSEEAAEGVAAFLEKREPQFGSG